MREYSKVSPTFWTGTTGRALRAKGTAAVVVGFYLLTAPGSNMLGLYYQPVLYLAHETGLGLEEASKGLADCIEAGFCKYDPATEMVWVVEMASWQIAEELKASDKRCLGVQRDYDSLQSNPFLGEFFDRYSGSFHLTERRSYEGASKPLASKEQEQEKEQERKAYSSSGKQMTPPADLNQHKTERLAQITDDAIASFNTILGQPNGLLPSIRPKVGIEKRRAQVGRCLRTARQICDDQTGSTVITREFWDSYFGTCSDDEFKSGRTPPGKGHENWKPSFEYLTREAVMLDVFDKAVAGEQAA